MFSRIEFKNFTVLKDTSLPLRPLTVIVGPNGSGKSTALQALYAPLNASRAPFEYDRLRPVDSSGTPEWTSHWNGPCAGVVTTVTWGSSEAGRVKNAASAVGLSTAGTRGS